MRVRILLPLAACVALAAPAAASADFAHTVTPGESLSSVAAADGMTVSQLAAANGISPDSGLVSGTTLMIPPQSGGSSESSSSSGDGDADSDDTGSASTSSSSPSPGGAYVVQPGDTLSGIAQRAGVSLDQLAAANGIDPNGLLLAGATLSLSGSSSGSEDTSSAATQPVGAQAEGSASGGPYPTPETVTPSEISQIASANGVPPSLAEGISDQESGFNNDLVSSADARGVMQILPGTWDWIQRSLAGGAPLSPSSALDNVRGGVLMLRSLLNSTGGDPAMAAAGYYQGLSSVQQNGMYPDTQQYVNDVMSLARQFGGG